MQFTSEILLCLLSTWLPHLNTELFSSMFVLFLSVCYEPLYVGVFVPVCALPASLLSHARLRCMCTCNRCTFCLCQNLLNSELLQTVRAKLYAVVLRRSLMETSFFSFFYVLTSPAHACLPVSLLCFLHSSFLIRLLGDIDSNSSLNWFFRQVLFLNY